MLLKRNPAPKMKTNRKMVKNLCKTKQKKSNLTKTAQQFSQQFPQTAEQFGETADQTAEQFGGNCWAVFVKLLFFLLGFA